MTKRERPMRLQAQPKNDRPELQHLRGCLFSQTRVRMANVSIGGLAVESSERLAVNKWYSVGVLRDNREIKLDGKVVWCEPTGSSEPGAVFANYRAGIEVDSILDSALTKPAKELLDLVSKEERRIFNRFPCEGNPVDLDCQYDFRVKSISPSGMLVEAELPAEIRPVFELEIGFPESVLRLQGHITSVLPIADTGRLITAELCVAFWDLPREDRQILESFTHGGH